MVRDGKWLGWAPTQLLGMELRGKTLGIIGYGRIARPWRARGVSACACSHRRARPACRSTSSSKIRHRLLPLSLIPETRHLIGAAELLR